MEIFIPIVIIFFIFSLISERIANFLKLNLPEVSEEQKFFKIFPGGPFRTKTKNPDIEKIRERRIFWLALISGLIVSFSAKANLFSMLKYMEKANQTLWWNTDRSDLVKFSENGIEIFFGCILTSLFISLGSKFWHDLLDLLLETKNLKSKINDSANWNFSTINAIDNYITEDESLRIDNAIEPIRKKLMEIENVISVASIYNNNIPILQVHVNSKFDKDNLIPKKVYYVGLNGSQKEMSITLIHDFEPIAHNAIWPSNEISNSHPYQQNTGSVGGKVYDSLTGEEYFLSCFHVVKSPTHSWNFQPNGNEIIINLSDGSKVCGEIINAIRDDEIDVAVMKAPNGSQIKSAISGIGTPYFFRSLNNNDKIYRTKVKMYGLVSSFRVGYVADINLPVRLAYWKENSVDSKEWHQLNKIIFINALSDPTFSQPGDSGSFVIDEYNYLIGVLVGGFQNVSYVIPIDTIFNKTKTKLTKS